jgi:uncharacterized membrane protein
VDIGPVQLLVIGFENGHFDERIQAELRRLRSEDAIRLLDLLFVRKHSDGQVERLQASDLSANEVEEFGSLVGALIGAGAAGNAGAQAGAEAGAIAAEDGHLLDDVWYVDDVLPPGMSVGIALIEHRWAIGLRDAISDGGGMLLADAWVHPLDLVAIGLAMADEVERELTH